MPIISFIITYHNEPLPLLAECLHSVLRVEHLMQEQELAREGVEVIVVDDGSQVSPESFIAGFDSRVRCVRQEAAGLSAARNHGMDCARGEYVQFVDADDALLPYAYCRVLQVMNQEADVILFRFTTQEADGILDSALSGHPCNSSCHLQSQVRHQDAPLPALPSGIDYLLRNNLRASACCYLMRRTLAVTLRFAEGLLHEDELFTPLLLLRAHRVTDTRLVAYYYRQRSSTITHSQTAHHRVHRLADTHEVLMRLRAVCSTLDGRAQRALGRRVEQLTADYIYNVWRLELQREGRAQRVRQLHEEHMLPLPLHPYTLRHGLFVLITRLPFALMDALLRRVVRGATRG